MEKMSQLSDPPVFEPEATKAITEAFFKVCQDLKLNGDAGVKEAVAVRIIELAQLGERDPERIRERVLREVRPDAARPWSEPALRGPSWVKA
jgi:hypothetical protein